jgi:proteasome lid subunit RPN8/RPN11
MKALTFKTLKDRVQPGRRALGELLAHRHIVMGSLPGSSVEDGPLLVVEEAAWLDVQGAAASDLGREQVGVLYGTAHGDGPMTWLHVTHAFHARSARGTRIHVALDREAWDDVFAQAAEAGIDGGDVCVLGWWHTHPDLGAFFSGTDRHTHERAFQRPWQVGLVIDPVRHERALFSGSDCTPIPLHPLVLAAPAPKRPDVPAEAAVLWLDDGTADLGAAAWTALARARNGVALHALPAPPPKDRSGLVFDRPQLKRAFPAAAARLVRSPKREGPWTAALPLRARDVACVLTRGLFRPSREILLRSFP